MQGGVRRARLALIFAAGGWVSLTTLEDALLAKLLGMALGAALVMVSSHRLQGQSKWIVWVLIGSLMLAPTKSVFLSRAVVGLCLMGTIHAQVIAPRPSGVQSTQTLPRQGSFIDSETLQPVIYSVPGFAVLHDVSVTYQNDAFLITLGIEEALPPNTQSRGRMVVEVWFRSQHSDGIEYNCRYNSRSTDGGGKYP